MTSPNIWQRIQDLYERDLNVGLRLDSAGLHAWIADRHFLRRGECDIKKGPGLAQDLQRWLDAEERRMRGARKSIGSSLQARRR